MHLPYVVESTASGERSYDTYSVCCKTEFFFYAVK